LSVSMTSPRAVCDNPIEEIHKIDRCEPKKACLLRETRLFFPCTDPRDIPKSALTIIEVFFVLDEANESGLFLP